jgi:hypothetical protein
VGVAGVVLSVAAGFNYASLPTAADRSSADSTQRALNISADVAVGVGIAALATGIVLLIADAAGGSQPAATEGAAQ